MTNEAQRELLACAREDMNASRQRYLEARAAGRQLCPMLGLIFASYVGVTATIRLADGASALQNIERAVVVGLVFVGACVHLGTLKNAIKMTYFPETWPGLEDAMRLLSPDEGGEILALHRLYEDRAKQWSLKAAEAEKRVRRLAGGVPAQVFLIFVALALARMPVVFGRP